MTTEIKSLEPVLLSPDAPVITANSEQPAPCSPRPRSGADGSRYLFAYNYTASPVTAEFTLGAAGGQHPRLRHRRDAARPTPARLSRRASSRTRRTSFSSAIPRRRRRRLHARRRRRGHADAHGDADAARDRHRDQTPTALRPGPRRATQTATATATATVPPPDCTATATASATPTATATPGALSVSPANLKFRAQKLGTTSRARNLKVTNTGGVTAKFTGMSVTGDFAQTNTCGATLAAHAYMHHQRNLQADCAGQANRQLAAARTTPPIVRRW